MGRYATIDGTTPDMGFAPVVRWQTQRLRSGRHKVGRDFVTPRRENDGALLREMAPSLTWIGHSTFVQRLGGKLLATDPIWSEEITTVVKRRSRPGVALADVPPLDVVTVSHSHYDHMDLPTLRRIGNDTIYVVPENNGEILLSQRFAQVVELGWWDSFRVPGGDLTITLVPAQHWSMRVPWDRNDRLWGGFVYQSPEGTSYHAGDTAFSKEELLHGDRSTIPADRLGDAPHRGVRARVVHVGAAHRARGHGAGVGAARREEPVRDALGDVRPDRRAPADPPARMRAWWAERGHDPSRLWVFDLGETRRLAGA